MAHLSCREETADKQIGRKRCQDCPSPTAVERQLVISAIYVQLSFQNLAWLDIKPHLSSWVCQAQCKFGPPVPPPVESQQVPTGRGLRQLSPVPVQIHGPTCHCHEGMGLDVAKLSLGGLTSCRTKNWKVKQDPLKVCGKSVSLGTGLCPGRIGRFLLRFPCITPARSQTQWKYCFTRLNIFSSTSPSEVLSDSASSSAAKEGEGLSQPPGEPGRLTQLSPSAEPPLGAEPGSGRKISGQPCPSCSQLGNLWTKCSRLGTGNEFAPCCRFAKDLRHARDGPCWLLPAPSAADERKRFHRGSWLLLTESYFLLGVCWP